MLGIANENDELWCLVVVTIQDAGYCSLEYRRRHASQIKSYPFNDTVPSAHTSPRCSQLSVTNYSIECMYISLDLRTMNPSSLE
jgi:hypothetical protein